MPTEDVDALVKEAREHELKVWPPYFAALWDGSKTFEVRRDDRGFQKGDLLLLREWDNRARSYTNRELYRTVSYVLHGDQFGVEPGFVVMGLEALRRPGREEIARVIEPDAWTYFDLPQGDGDDWGKFDAWKRSSLRKADAILALFSPAPQQRGVV